MMTSRCPRVPLYAVPPSPDMARRIRNTKASFLLGKLLPGVSTADILDMRSFALIKHRPAYTRAHTLGAEVQAPAPAIGNRKALVLLVDFSDNIAKESRQHYSDMLFSNGTYPTGRLMDYYWEVSYHKLTVTGDVNGGNSDWHRAPKPYSYYAGDKYGFGNYPNNAYKLVEDVVALASKYINFAEYDGDGDGMVDALFIVHAGPGAEETGRTDQIWSHMSTINPITLNGVKIARYSMEPENGRLGVFCHEFAHVLGLPDLYDYDMDSAGTGLWDLMAMGCWNNDGQTPAHPIGWCKAKLGWINPSVATSNQQNISLRPSAVYPELLRVPPEGSGKSQYFLLENRKKVGFDRFLPGEGLLILHIDEGQSNNNDQTHYLVDVEQCDGRCDLNKNANYGDLTDPFPNGQAVAFSSDTNPSSKLYNGADSKIAVTEIIRSGDSITTKVSTAAAAQSGPSWYYNKIVSSASAGCQSQMASASISDLGWRKIMASSSDGITNILSLCCQAMAKGCRVNVCADGGFIYTLYLV